MKKEFINNRPGLLVLLLVGGCIGPYLFGGFMVTWSPGSRAYSFVSSGWELTCCPWRNNGNSKYRRPHNTVYICVYIFKPVQVSSGLNLWNEQQLTPLGSEREREHYNRSPCIIHFHTRPTIEDCFWDWLIRLKIAECQHRTFKNFRQNCFILSGKQESFLITLFITTINIPTRRKRFIMSNLRLSGGIGDTVNALLPRRLNVTFSKNTPHLKETTLKSSQKKLKKLILLSPSFNRCSWACG